MKGGFLAGILFPFCKKSIKAARAAAFCHSGNTVATRIPPDEIHLLTLSQEYESVTRDWVRLIGRRDARGAMNSLA